MNVSSLRHANTTLPSSFSIKVLTPTIVWAENQYLTCLWSAVRAFGVEIEAFELRELMPQVKAGKALADVIHINWVHRFCKFDRDRPGESVRFALRRLRDFYILRSKGYQLVWTVHNTLSHDCIAPRFEQCFRWAFSRLCSDIIVMSEYSKQEFVRLYGRRDRIHVVPHGNYIGAYANHMSREEAREKLKIAPQQKVLLYFGQVKPYKGVDHLLAAFGQLHDPDAVLLIAGSCRDADLSNTIHQAAEVDPRILSRLEFIPDDDIQLYMNACDWVVLPYQAILNSGSALLALSYRRPVIVPQRGALTELVVAGQHGLHYTQDSKLVEALQQALTTSLTQWQEMCSHAYQRAQEYDWSKIGKQIYQIYQQGV